MANVAGARGFETAKSAYSGLMVAMNLDEMGNKAERDQWLSRIVQESDHAESESDKEVAVMIEQDIKGIKEALTDESIESLAGRSSDESKTEIYYFAGRYLINKGEKERGKSYLAKSRDLFYVDRWASDLSAVLLEE